MYERRIESSLYWTMAELRKLRGQPERAARVSHIREEPLIPDTHPIRGRRSPRGVPPCYPEQEHWEEGEKVRESEARTVLPSSDSASCHSAAFGLPEGTITNGTEAERPSCETKPISEGVSRLKCQVLSQASRVASAPNHPTSDFPPQTFGGTPTA